MTDWDQRFMGLAREVSTWSKDPSRKIGAVAVNSMTRQVLSLAFNGFPRGIKDSEERLNDRETKYKLVCHAEQNLIYNATLNGISLNSSVLYVYGLPVCSECAKGVIQVGIKRVLMCHADDIPQKWSDSGDLTKEMFMEAGVVYTRLHEGRD